MSVRPYRPAEWELAAACRGADPDEFFVDRTGNALAARRVCLTCPVSEECLDAALARDERFGVWGGVHAGSAEWDLLRLRKAAES